MAKDPSKTEKATPRRRQKAREEGQVARSLDVPIAATLFITFLVLLVYIPYFSEKLREYFIYIFSNLPNLIPSISHGQVIEISGKEYFLLIVPIFLALLIAGLIANLAQIGFLLTTKPLIPKLDRLNPVSGFLRILSLKTVFELVRNLLKLAVATAVGYFLFMKIYHEAQTLQFMDLSHQIYFLVKYMLMMILFFALLSIPIAIIDFFYRRFEFEENIKMTKQEVKEEQKMYEGNPQIKAAIRRKQREIAMKRMMAEVPKADVVITNPTHYAVALKYDREKDIAPKVVAKGKDNVALKIIEIAKEHNVPVVQDPPLARALYESCDIGDYIPEQFYQVIAKILALIYKEKGIRP